MPKFFEELKRIRRFLRDPSARIWSDDLLMSLWNEVQRDLQVDRRLLEEVATLSSPPKYHVSYLFDWEYAYLDTNEPSYRALRDQGGYYVATSRFEHQVAQGFDIDVSDVSQAYTHPWESWYASPGAIVDYPLPADFHTMQAFWYDRWPISWCALRTITRDDPSWTTRTGKPQCYTRRDDTKNEITIYPRPNDVAWNDETGTDGEFSGLVAGIEDDTFTNELGVITFRTDSMLTQEVGVAISVLDVEENATMVYDVMPLDVEGPGDQLSMPDWMLKYIRFGVLARAFLANTDGRIPSLAAYWNQRYELGMRALKRYQWNTKEDRDYQLRTRGVPSRIFRRHPRLPDTYPATVP